MAYKGFGNASNERKRPINTRSTIHSYVVYVPLYTLSGTSNWYIYFRCPKRAKEKQMRIPIKVYEKLYSEDARYIVKLKVRQQTNLKVINGSIYAVYTI